MAICDAVMVLLARGGSKGIAQKNIQMLNGVPLVRRSVKTALEANVFKKIIVSSDDPVILKVVSDLPISIHTRSDKNSDDNATSEDAISEVFGDFNIHNGFCFLIQCTTPFVTAVDIINTFELLQRNKTCSIISGYIDSMHHWYVNSNHSEITPIGKDMLFRSPRQRGQQVFVENGGIYAFEVESFIKNRSRFMPNVIPYVMEKHLSVDIDNSYDLEIARYLISSRLDRNT